MRASDDLRQFCCGLFGHDVLGAGFVPRADRRRDRKFTVLSLVGIILKEIARFELQEVRSSDQTDPLVSWRFNEAILAPCVPEVAKTERNRLESKRFTEFFPRRSQPTTSGHVSQTDSLWVRCRRKPSA